MTKYKVVTSTAAYPITEERKSGIKVVDHHENLEWLLEHFSTVIRHNKMTRKREILIPGMDFFKDDIDNDTLARIEDLATLNGMPYKQTDKFLSIIAGKNPYHPIVECILAQPWDGIPRLRDFIKTIVSTQPDLDRLVIETWMMAAIAAAFSEYGFTNHGVLVLQGAQGIGKTAWVKSLDPINCGAIKTGALLDPRNKDSIIGLCRFWIAELGELDGTFNKTDIAHLKSFITSDSDDVRVPWGRKETHLVRRTAYVATVNNSNFLVDDTGNRRWWTIAATAINYEHDFNMQQVWAEAKFMLDAGAKTYLDREIQSELNEKNKSHEKIDPIRELLTTNYDWHTKHRRELTATDVLIELDYKKPSHGEVIRAGKILSSINNKGGRKTNGITVHEIPEKIAYGFHFKG